MVWHEKVRTNCQYAGLTATGGKHGKMDKGQENGVSVQYCAAKIDNAVKRNKKQVLIGKKELIMAYLKRFAPWLFYKIALKIDPNA